MFEQQTDDVFEHDSLQLSAANSRHEARERALQILYAIEIAEHDPETACDELLNSGEERYLAFARKLVLLTVEHREKMDDLIRDKAQRWDLNRIAMLDRLILRIALCELFHIADVPPKVTINEAIEVAKEYSTDQSGRFINGILDAVFGANEKVIRRSKSPGVFDSGKKAAEKQLEKKSEKNMYIGKPSTEGVITSPESKQQPEGKE